MKKAIERFEKKILVTNDCWFWTASKTKQGYGMFSYDGKSIAPKNSNIVISLKNFNELTGINKKKNTVNVQAGTKIVDLLFDLKKENFVYSFLSSIRQKMGAKQK